MEGRMLAALIQLRIGARVLTLVMTILDLRVS
jgi:hypothetical protein